MLFEKRQVYVLLQGSIPNWLTFCDKSPNSLYGFSFYLFIVLVFISSTLMIYMFSVSTMISRRSIHMKVRCSQPFLFVSNLSNFEALEKNNGASSNIRWIMIWLDLQKYCLELIWNLCIFIYEDFLKKKLFKLDCYLN